MSPCGLVPIGLEFRRPFILLQPGEFEFSERPVNEKFGGESNETSWDANLRA